MLLLLAAGCGGGPSDPAAALSQEFPLQAPKVLGAGRGFARDAGRYLPTAPAVADVRPARPNGRFRGRLKIELPEDGSGEIVLRGEHGFEARVREEGMTGGASQVDRSVIYARAGGASFWTTAPGGVEEWLHIEAGRVTPDRPAATWHIKGARIRPRGTAIELVGVDGKAEAQVTAPMAYAAGGRQIKPELRARGDASASEGAIDLYVDANGEQVLVDPLWLATAAVPFARANHAAAAVGDPWGSWDIALITGGTDGTAAATASTAYYDFTSDEWWSDFSMSTPRACHTATTLPDGTALIVGGMNDTGGLLDSAEIYDWYNYNLSQEDPMGFSRMNHTATTMQNGEVLVVGGRGDYAMAPVEGAADGQQPSPQFLGSGTFDCWNPPSGGGSGSGGPGTTSFVDVFSQVEGNFWYGTSSLYYARERHTATLLQTGDVLVVGGEDNGFIHNTSEAYYQGSWSYPVTMNAPREDHTATLLNDGSVLITGGHDGAGPTATAEIYVPSGGSGSGGGGGVWVLTAPMSTPRTHHTAALLPDGTVIVAGGSNGTTALATAEIYDPVAQTWSPALPMNVARSEATGTMLTSGGWVVAGGVDDTSNATPTADVYWYELPLGFPCTDGSQCASTFCVEGVCCDSECSGTCYTCRGQSQPAALNVSIGVPITKAGIIQSGDGYCNSADWGTDPRNDCADDGVENCGSNGLCDGEGSCMTYESNDVCVAAYCEGNVAIYDAYCDGEGLCQPPSNVEDCGAGQCVTGSCYFDCGSDVDCSTAGWCNDGGCDPKKTDGQPTNGDNECASGFAADGVCCDSPCAGICSACTSALKGGGLDGVCGPIKVGTDPDVECTAQPASTCGGVGSCDGAGACALYPAGTVCSPGSCSGSTLVQADLCDGNGHCIDTGDVSCAPNLCSGGTCLSTCAVDPDCVATAFCNGTQCAPKATLGAPATAPNECLSGFLADGVCCDAACAGSCVACTALQKGGGADGTCGPIAAGSDPDNECANAGAASCGTSGLCDGLGACQLYSSGTICTAASCSGTTLTPAGLCNGTGTCVAGNVTDCSPAQCSAGTCQSTCSVDGDCVSSGYCSSGTCAAKKAVGGSATTPNECLSGFVADGVCCDTSCVGACVACTAAKKGSGSDGACGPIANGADPDHECAAQAASTCGVSGSCNGIGACALYPAGTLCSPASCSGSTLTEPSLCDGVGTCVAGGNVDCKPAACTGGTCGSSCTNDAECVSTAYCGGGSTCVTKKNLGEAATGPNECLSGFLVDGFCCDTACAGTCVACSAAKKGLGADGACGPILGGSDPDDECSDDGAASCGHNGWCSGQGACDFYVAGTVCNSASCQGNTAIHADVCDGSGSCGESGQQDCGLTLCVGGVCADSCVFDADCSTSVAYCDSTAHCAPKKLVGEGATGNNQCLTGFMADGVCCDSACAGGPCDACSVAAGATAEGVCTPQNGAACNDGDQCTLVDSCQGGVCQGANPIVCESTDQCQDPGACDAISGACSLVPKANGTACDDGNPCTIDACQTGACKGLSKLDGTLCPGGICIAGGCLLDPTLADGGVGGSSGGGGAGAGSTGTVTLTTAPGTGGTAGVGGNGDFAEDRLPNLVGGGCLSVAPVEDRPSGAAPVGLLLGLLAMLRRRFSRGRAS